MNQWHEGNVAHVFDALEVYQMRNSSAISHVRSECPNMIVFKDYE